MPTMKELIHTLNQAAKAYYQEDREILSDREYDSLFDELVHMEEATGTILSNSPTQRVGYIVADFLPKVSHEAPMLSLDKTKEIEKMKSWLGDKTGLLSWKLDGLTIVLYYQDGTLRQAVTRGDGTTGEDITHNVRVFQNIPLHIPFSGRLTLRGEAILSYTRFREINEALPEEEAYKNPRNLCSGTVRQLNSEIAARRGVEFYAFSVVQAEGANLPDSKSERLDWLLAQGFDVVEHCLVEKSTLEEWITDFQNSIKKNDFATDGLVLTYDSVLYSVSLGQTSRFPRDSIAYKWADETAETILRSMEWNTSRTGRMNPVALFDPVELEGSTVSRASVHNVSVLEELALGLGDRLLVYKANMIIPQIAENLTKSGTVEIPQNCFVCGGETEIQSQKEGKTLFCTNPNCHAQRLRALSHFVSRDALNIEGLSEETLKKLLDTSLIDTYPDLFHLEEHREVLINMEGLGEKSAQNLLASIEKARHTTLPRLLYALGIHHVGVNNARLLCRHFSYDLSKIQNATEDMLVQIDGFGEIIAHNVYRYFHEEANIALLQRVLPFLTLEEPLFQPEEAGLLSGKTFVITGDLIQVKNRKELQDMIEQNGGKVTGSVSKKTNYLINNDVDSTSGKNKKAKELAIPILTEADFLDKLSQKKSFS